MFWWLAQSECKYRIFVILGIAKLNNLLDVR